MGLDETRDERADGPLDVSEIDAVGGGSLPVETRVSVVGAHVQVVLVADDPLVRSGLSMVLTSRGAGSVSVAEQISSRDDVEAAVRRVHEPVVLWDLGADPRAVSERLGHLSEVDAPVVALLPDESHAQETLGAGAVGILLRSADGAMLSAALRAVSAGLVVVDPSLASVLPSRERATGRPTEDLTAREVEVLQLLAVGLANKVIAQRLGISDHTVKFHVNAIMTKLGVQSRTEAVVRAARLGLVIL